ncbi:CTP:molybdopterin cytidylyltransferase MocA [Desmospora profundinema]|uniref:CTP:molybdopterin cytidylyltransferase MocA n=2 Tax=Desmospora profundinema TaxID=1571184 RepID=A0ABU1IPR0_9BACL|nr:CTP:molybdopterin cytidylyltransferase MocA [Desmospora profundinema]
MIILADQPLITVKMINHIIRLYQTRKEKYIASCYRGVPRPPVLFDSEMFPDLYQIQGDEGARRILRKDPDRGLKIEYKHGKSFLDIDTPSEYQSLCEFC